jgi:peroxiredoxin
MALTFPASPPSFRRLTLFFGIAAVAAAGGLFVGGWLDAALEPNNHARVINRGSVLADGQLLPTVALENADGFETTTRRLAGDRGAVFLFLSPTCEMCPELINQWNEVIAADTVPGLRVFGVMNEKGQTVQDFLDEHGVRFPVFRDREQAFSIVYEVVRYPLEVIVGRDTRIRRRRNLVTSPLDLDAVRQIFAE